MSSLSLFGAGAGALVLLPVVLWNPVDRPGADASSPARNRYVGVKVCKNCHKDEDKGGAFPIWEKSAHAEAYETLATPKAKEIAAQRGIDDPQKSAECLQCHVTAHDAGKREVKRSFKIEDGVQCETCHGPGEQHFKERFKAQSAGDDSPIGADEIVTSPGVENCLECHNEKSPTYEPFCFKERMAKIRHLDPRKERSAEELKKLEEQCYEGCPKCSKAKGEGAAAEKDG